MTDIFVFGSNLAGEHHGGSAYAAFKDHGALWGVGVGPQGNSYAIPTLDEYLDRMDTGRIAVHVQNFLGYASEHKDMKFRVVAIGCGIAGFKPEEIAPMFRFAPSNCVLPPEFVKVLEAA